jgi:hypothetical protein
MKFLIPIFALSILTSCITSDRLRCSEVVSNFFAATPKDDVVFMSTSSPIGAAFRTANQTTGKVRVLCLIPTEAYFQGARCYKEQTISETCKFNEGTVIFYKEATMDIMDLLPQKQKIIPRTEPITNL